MKQARPILSTAFLIVVALGSIACRGPEKETSAAPAARPAAVEASDLATRPPRAAGGPAVIWLGLDGLD